MRSAQWRLGVAANRVVYAREGVREWYANGPLGLEQGFDLRSRPARGSGPLTLAVSLAGDLRVRLERGVVLLTGRGVQLRYGDLLATDTRGRVLPWWVELAGDRVLIRVADRGARYPLRIDPFVQQGPMLVGHDAGSGARQGTSVALSADGNTALIGGQGQRRRGGGVGVHPLGLDLDPAGPEADRQRRERRPASATAWRCRRTGTPR